MQTLKIFMRRSNYIQMRSITVQLIQQLISAQCVVTTFRTNYATMVIALILYIAERTL